MGVPQATAMPAFAPLFAVGREEVNVDWMTMTYRTSPELLSRILPAPLKLGALPEVGVWMAEFKNAEFIAADGSVERRPSYMQGGVSVRCAYHGTEGAYALCTYVEGLNHGILGRELFGFPKKQVRRASLERQGNVARVEIENARGVGLLRADVRYTGDTQNASPAPDWFGEHFTLKIIPSAEGVGFDISRLVQVPWVFAPSESLSIGTAELEWTPDASDPMHLLTVESDCTVVHGNSRLGIDFGIYRDDVTQFETFGVPTW